MNPFSIIARSRLRLECSSAAAFAIYVSVAWAVLYNSAFWRGTLAALWTPTASGALFIGSLFIVLVVLQALILLALPRFLLRPVAGALFLVAAAASYFASAYGVLFDKEMIRNVAQTDASEVSSLLGPHLFVQVALLGVLPCIIVSRISIRDQAWQKSLRARGIFAAAGLVLAIAGVFLSSASYAAFLREHKPLRYSITPGSVVYAAASLLGATHDTQPRGPLLDPGGKPVRLAMAGRKPLVLFLVIGETARAASFQLGGYPRETNPELERRDDLAYFGHVLACGTSTAVSVPCLFSGMGREAYDQDTARHSLNLLDTLARAGFDVQWRDNNAGCKGVCARVSSTAYAGDTNEALCAQAYCYDERMLTDLEPRLRSIERDTVIVFHQIGSHGPAYFERYPPQFEVFRPTCRSPELGRCTREQVRNAYDNSIRYTDHVLARQIGILQQISAHADGLLIYVSDHGESLGEHGIYLHGMPYALAPREQKEVPLLIWMSAGYREHAGVSLSCLRAQARTGQTHDNVFHTVMGLLGVRNRAYREQLDLTSSCRPGRLVSTPSPVPPVRKDPRSS